MVKYFLISLLQLLSGVTIPLYTVRYGRMKVPIVLHYQMESDSSQLAVAPGWTLRIGEDACVEDDAGNRIEVLPEGIFWPKGAVSYSFVDGRVKGFTVLSADSTTVFRVAFETDLELHEVLISGRDTIDVQRLVMEYADTALLRSITRSGGGSVEFAFVPDAGRMLKRCVCRKDAAGQVTGVSEYAYSSDSLCQTITETVADGQAVIRKVVHSFTDGQIWKKEEFTGNGRLKRTVSYRYMDDDGKAFLESVTATCYPQDSLASLYTNIHSYKYAVEQPYPYPVEVESSDSDGICERLAYTYPFCPSPSYGSTADSLLKRGMADAVLSVSRWKDGSFVDSTTVVYGSFQAVNASSGKVFCPSAIVYSDGGTQADTCIKYTAYDTLGLRMSRATTLHKQSADRLSPEVFRWRGPNPLADLLREQRSYEVCAAWPEIAPNQEWGKSYLFDGSGGYLGKVEAGEPAGRVVADMGFGETPLSASFADPDNTPLLIDRHTDLELVSPEAAEAELTKAGASSREPLCSHQEEQRAFRLLLFQIV